MISLTPRPIGRPFVSWEDYLQDAYTRWPSNEDEPGGTMPTRRWVTPLLGSGWPFWPESDNEAEGHMQDLFPASAADNDPIMLDLEPVTTCGDPELVRLTYAALLILRTAAEIAFAPDWLLTQTPPITVSFRRDAPKMDLAVQLDQLGTHPLGGLYVSQTVPDLLELDDLIRLRDLHRVANLPEGPRCDHWLSKYRPTSLDTVPDALRTGLSNATTALINNPSIDAATIAVAELLWRQARGRRSSLHGVDQPPPAVAFATGASMALEIAVLSGPAEEANEVVPQVTIVLPAFVQPPVAPPATHNAERHWVWLALTLSTDDLQGAMEHALEPDSFVVLTDRQQSRAFLAKVDHPVVVHLKGVPQLRLPSPVNGGEFAAALGRVTGVEFGHGEEFQVRHAIVGGDFLGMQQAWFESFLFPSTTGEWKHTRSLALPRSFTSSDSPGFQRFWYMAGVGLDATPTRLQVTPRLSRSPLDRVGEELDRRIGVAVNRRIGDDENLLLRWSGIDVVKCEINETVGSLSSVHT